MVAVVRSRAGWWFAPLLLVLIGVEWLIIQHPAFLQRPMLPAAVSFDVLVGVPVLFYFLLVRPYRLPVTSVVAAFGAAIALGHWLLPAGQQTYLGWAERGAGAAELAVAGVALLNLRRLRRAYRAAAAYDPDVLAALRAAFQAVLGRPLAPLTTEIGQFYYALLSWRARPETRPTDHVFTLYKESAFTAYMVVVGFISMIEMGAIHLLLVRWSPTAALVAGILHLYGLLWLAAHLRAVRLRPVRLSSGGELILNAGMAWELRVPVAAVLSTAPLTDAPAKERGLVNFAGVLLTPPNVLLTFREPQRAQGPYGITRSVHQVALFLDDPAGFRAAVAAGAGAASGIIP